MSEQANGQSEETGGVLSDIDLGAIDVEKLVQDYQPFVIEMIGSVIAALAIFFIGKWIAGMAKNGVTRVMHSRGLDVMLVSFISNLLHAVILAFAVIAALGQIGIQTASFVAIIGAAGLAVGLALQGSLSNFAAGVLLLIFRPLKVGDFVEAGGISGTVEEVTIFTTTFRTGDNKVHIVPNSKITSGVITNFSTKPTRRAEWVLGIGYDDDIDKAKDVINEVLKDERVHADPAPMVFVSSLGDSAVNITVRAWTDSGNFWPLTWDLNERFKKALDAADINIPYPQRDVHIIGNQPAA